MCGSLLHEPQHSPVRILDLPAGVRALLAQYKGPVGLWAGGGQAADSSSNEVTAHLAVDILLLKKNCPCVAL